MCLVLNSHTVDLQLHGVEAERMCVHGVKATQCPAAPVSNLNRECFQRELWWCEVGSNGYEEMNVAMKSALCWDPVN